jgi:hypothetical protein
MHQLDVKSAFLHGDLDERVYCQQHAGFIDDNHPDHVCLLSKSLYGLKQAPRAWFQTFSGHLLQLGFTTTRSDSSLFVLHQGSDTVYLLLYVDIILITSSTTLLQRIIDNIKSSFVMKDLGPLHFFLGIQVQRSSKGFHLHQACYAADLLDHAGMRNCKPASTPVDTKPKALANDGKLATVAAFYRSIVGTFQYLTLMGPNITYAINQVYLHMHAPMDVHCSLDKQILLYVCGTLSHSILIHATLSTSMVANSDTDWAGCPDTRHSTSGYCVFLSDTLISSSSKHQTVMSCSSPEAEYRGVANATAECRWLRNRL